MGFLHSDTPSEIHPWPCDTNRFRALLAGEDSKDIKLSQDIEDAKRSIQGAIVLNSIRPHRTEPSIILSSKAEGLHTKDVDPTLKYRC